MDRASQLKAFLSAMVAVSTAVAPAVQATARGEAASATPAPTLQEGDDLPEGYQQILPRGRIAAIDDPDFVSAEEAEIADDAWVLGVVIDGEARAYSLNLLNAHEVVNDRIGDTEFAAVW